MVSLLPPGTTWRSRALWLRIGYTATAIWMVAILAITREDTSHPLFQHIFAVPLVGWIIGTIAGKLIARRWPEKGAGAKPPGELPPRP
ncbi:MAG: hypothetical protein ACHQF3_06830 [Alphaproteobacteria bacterium]